MRCFFGRFDLSLRQCRCLYIPVCSTIFLRQESQQTTSKQHMQPLAHQAQFHPLQQSHHQHHINQSQHMTHFSHNQQCGPQSHLPEIVHSQQSPTISPQMACLQQLGHVGGRMHIVVRDLFKLLFPRLFFLKILTSHW